MNTSRGALVNVSNTYKDSADLIASPATKVSDKSLQQSSPMSFNDSGTLLPSQDDSLVGDLAQKMDGAGQQEAPQSPVSFSDSNAAPIVAGSPAGAVAVKRSGGSAQLRAAQSPVSFSDSSAAHIAAGSPAGAAAVKRSGGSAQGRVPQSPVSFSDSSAAPIIAADSSAGAAEVKRSGGSVQLRVPQSPVSFSDSNAAPIAAGSPAGAVAVKRSGGSAQLKVPQSPVSFGDNIAAPISAEIMRPLPSIYDAFLNDENDLSGPMIVTPPSGGVNHETLPSYAHSPSVTGRLSFSEFLSPVLNASYLLEREQQSEAKRRQEEEDSYRSETQRLSDIIVSLEQEVALISKQSSERIFQLQAEVDEHQQELTQEKLVAEAKVAQLDEGLVQANTLIASTNQQLGEAKVQAEQLQSQASELSSQLSERTAQLQAKVDEHKELVQEKSEAEAKVAQLDKKLAQANTLIDSISQKLREAQAQAGQLQVQKNELLMQLSEKTAQLQVKLKEHQEILRKEKTEAEANIATLNEKLAQANSLTRLKSQEFQEAQAQAEYFKNLHVALLGELSAKNREHKEEVGGHKALLTQRQSEAEENFNLLFILYLITQEKLNKSIESKKEVEARNSNDFIDLAAEYERKLDIAEQNQNDRILAQMAENDSKHKNIATLKTLGYSHDDNLVAYNQFKEAKELFFEARKNSSLQLAGSSDIDGLIAKLNELSVQFKHDTGIINSYTQTLATAALCFYGDGGENPFHRLNNLANGRYYQSSESDELVKRIIPEKARSPFLYLLVGIVLVTAVIAAGVFLLPASMTSGVVSTVTANLNSSVPAIVAAGASVLLTGSFFHKPEAPRAAQARVVCEKLEEERNRVRV